MATVQQGPETRALTEALGQVMRRLRLQRWVRHASRGALLGIVASYGFVALAHFNLLPSWLPLEAVIPALLLLGVGVGTVTAYARPIPPMAAARLVETRLGLKERLSSALEFSHTSGGDAADPEAALLRRLQQQDAASHARALAPQQAVPLRWPPEAKALIPALVLLLLALVLPTLSVFVPPALRDERAVVAKSGEKLTEVARRLEKDADTRHLDAAKRDAAAMRKLGQQMAQGKMDKREAMTRMAALREQMQRDQARTAGSPAEQKSLSEAGQQLSRSLSSSTDSNPQASPKTGASSAEIQKAAQAMRQADAAGLSRQMQELARRLPTGPASPAAEKATAQDLQKLARALQNTPLSETQKHAQAAADALKRGDRPGAAQEMAKAADAAQRELQQDAQHRQDSRGAEQAQSSLQNSQDEMAQASKPGDIKPDGQPESAQSQSQASPSGHPQTAQGQSGQPQAGQKGQSGSKGHSGQGAGQKSGQSGQGAGQRPGRSAGPGQASSNAGNSASGQGGAPTNGGQGAGGGATKPGPGRYSGDSGQNTGAPSHHMGVQLGAPHPLDAKFDPSKNPNNGKIFLGKPSGDSHGGGKGAPPSKLSAGSPLAPGQHAVSSVPYYNYAPAAKAQAEKTVDTEDIPPSYRKTVGDYFNAIQPPAKSGGAPK